MWWMCEREASILLRECWLWRSHCRLPPRSPHHWIRLNLWFMCRLWGLKYISTMKSEGEIHHWASDEVSRALYHIVSRILRCDAERAGTQKNLLGSKYSPIQSQTPESTWRAPPKRCHNKSVFKLESEKFYKQASDKKGHQKLWKKKRKKLVLGSKIFALMLISFMKHFLN